MQRWQYVARREMCEFNAGTRHVSFTHVSECWLARRKDASVSIWRLKKNLMKLLFVCIIIIFLVSLSYWHIFFSVLDVLGWIQHIRQCLETIVNSVRTNIHKYQFVLWLLLLLLSFSLVMAAVWTNTCCREPIARSVQMWRLMFVFKKILIFLPLTKF